MAAPVPTDGQRRDDLRRLGALIRSARLAIRLGSTEVAARALIDHSSLWRLEEGKLRELPHRSALHNVVQVVRPGFWRTRTWGELCEIAARLGFDPYASSLLALFLGLDGETTPQKVRMVLPLLRGLTFNGDAHGVVGLGLGLVRGIESSEWQKSPEAAELLSITYKELAFAYNQSHVPGEYWASVDAALRARIYAGRVTAPNWLPAYLQSGANIALGSIARVLEEEQRVRPSLVIRQLHDRCVAGSLRRHPLDTVVQSGTAVDRVWALVNLVKQAAGRQGKDGRDEVERLAGRAIQKLEAVTTGARQAGQVFADYGLEFGSTALLLPFMVHEAAGRAFTQVGATTEAGAQLGEARPLAGFSYCKFQIELTRCELLIGSKTSRDEGLDQLRALIPTAPSPYPRHKAERLLEQATKPGGQQPQSPSRDAA